MSLPSGLKWLDKLEELSLGPYDCPLPSVVLSNLKKLSMIAGRMDDKELASWITRNVPSLREFEVSHNFERGHAGPSDGFFRELGEEIRAGSKIPSLRTMSWGNALGTYELIVLFTQILPGLPKLESIRLGQYNKYMVPNWDVIGDAVVKKWKNSTARLTEIDAPQSACTLHADFEDDKESCEGILKVYETFKFL